MNILLFDNLIYYAKIFIGKNTTSRYCIMTELFDLI